MNDFKIVVVGEGAVGKSCLLIHVNLQQFPTDYAPMVFDNYQSLHTATSEPTTWPLFPLDAHESHGSRECAHKQHRHDQRAQQRAQQNAMRKAKPTRRR